MCGASFKRNKMLSDHIKTHNISLEEYFNMYFEDVKKCKKCGDTLVFKNNISVFDNKIQTRYIGYYPLCQKCNVRGFTKEKAILVYGEAEGNNKWEKYCEQQRFSNSFEYKKEKHGWTEEEYQEYNNSRAITLENLKLKYGDEEGEQKFKSYCEKQKDAGCSLDYFKTKYGEELGTEKYNTINKLKAITLQNFQIKYGDELGSKKFLEYKETVATSYSKASQEICQYLFDNTAGKNDHMYYASLNKEFGKLDEYNKNYYYYDFVDTERKKVIEYNGMLYHAKAPDDKEFFNPRDPKRTAKESYEKDKRKQQLMEDLGFEYLVVWEDEYLKNKEKVLNKCLQFLIS